MLNSQISLQAHYEQLIAAPTPERCWEIILDACRSVGYHRVELTLAGRTFEWQDGVDPMNTWDVTIPISDTDHARLTRSFGGGPEPNVIAPFADLLRHALVPKLPVFAAMSRLAPEEIRETLVETTLSEDMEFEPSARGD